jgi:hypothetical protein
MESATNWEQEKRRFMTIVYRAILNAARRAFWHWRHCKRDDAIQECHAKMWDQRSRLVQNGKNPEKMIGPLIKFAILWVRYDRKIGGRARTPDIYDYRTGFKQQQISDQGLANPSDWADANNNAPIDSNLHTGDDPSALAAALETTGTTLSQWCDF